jgi:hypothetical protein
MIISLTRKNKEVFDQWIDVLNKNIASICQTNQTNLSHSFNILIVSYTEYLSKKTIHGFATVLTSNDSDIVYIRDFCASKNSQIASNLIDFIVEKGRQNNKQAIQINVPFDEERFWTSKSFYKVDDEIADEKTQIVMKRQLIHTHNEAFAKFLTTPPSTIFPTSEDLAYLPPLPRVDASASQYEQKVHNIITGVVARSSTDANWGIKIGNDIVGSFKDPSFKLYTITEIDPTDSTKTYSVYYVYLTQSNSYTNFNLFKTRTACGKVITKALEHAVLAIDHTAQSGINEKELSYEPSALMVVNRYWNDSDRMTERGMWISLLVFSSDHSNTAVILSTTYGLIQNLPVAIDDQSSDEKIKLPYFSLVGNIETISAHALKYIHDVDSLETNYEPDLEMRREVQRLKRIRDFHKEHKSHVFKTSNITSIQTGSCTLNMSLTMMILRSLNYSMMYLENAGDIPGCKCYSTAAGVNEMFSLLYQGDDVFMYPLDKTIRGDGTPFRIEKYKLYRLFNSLHCDPKSYFARTEKQSEKSEIHEHNFMFFIDKKKLTDVYRLFKKLDYMQKKKLPITNDHILTTTTQHSPRSKKRKHE